MCDYQGYEFGAGRYPDSVCIDGFLWDADSGHACDDGWLYTNGGDIPCPICKPQEAIAYHAEQNEFFLDDDEDERDEEGHKRRALDAAISLVNDIRKNRGLEPVEFDAATQPAPHHCGQGAKGGE